MKPIFRTKEEPYEMVDSHTYNQIVDELNPPTYYCDIYSSFKHMADSKLISHSNFVISIIPTTLRFFLRGIQQSLLDYIKRASIFCSRFFKFYNETTPDGLITLKEGECMGACGDAPVMIVNNRRMCSWMNPEQIDKLLAELK